MTERKQRSVRARAWRRLYATQRWRARRRQQLQRFPLCCMCERSGKITAATVADHIIPHRGNEDLFFYGELQSLCKHHHDSVKQSEERLGFSKEIGSDGWPLDDAHPANEKIVASAGGVVELESFSLRTGDRSTKSSHQKIVPSKPNG